MEKSYYLAVDLGATSGRCVLAAFDGQRVELQEFARFRNPIIPMSGHSFWNLPALYYEILQALKKVAEAHITLTSIGIDTWGCDFALFTADGRLAGLPYSYRDPHTEGAMDAFFERMPAEKVYQLTGIQFMDFNSLFQLDTLRRGGCSALESADKILFTPDALSYLLTGEAVTEYTVASTSQILNPTKGDLDEELLDALSLPRERFGRMVLPGTVVGRLTPQVRQYTGLGDVPVVAVAGHDTASAVAAVPAADGNFAYLSCGTWSLLGVEIPEPMCAPEVLRAGYTNEGGAGYTRFQKNIMGMWVINRLKAELAPEKSFDDVMRMGQESSFDELVDVNAPCFLAPVSMKAAFDGALSEKPGSPGDYFRCAHRSLAMSYRSALKELSECTGKTFGTLYIVGGGARNKWLNELTQQFCNIRVVALPIEATALGNLRVQMRN